jgi:hypothetical protein
MEPSVSILENEEIREPTTNQIKKQDPNFSSIADLAVIAVPVLSSSSLSRISATGSV